MTEKETMDSMDDWENCKGQCGYTRFCRKCMRERDRLIRERKKAERKRIPNAGNKAPGFGDPIPPEIERN